MSNLSIKSAVARLLATENIQVNQTNSKTAWFDVEKRVLNLPLWDVEPYVYDMLVGHEVGHALYTPADGWHESITDLGIPRSYVNVIEDARIEKLVKRKYPGLVFTFNRAYGWMAEEDFFKIKNMPVEGMKLIDRINLQFKLGASMDVPFTDAEQPFVDRVAKAETFEDVVTIAKDILAFWKENKEEVREELTAGMDDSYDDMPDEDMFGDDGYGYDEDETAGDEESEAEDGEDTTAGDTDSDEPEEDKEGDPEYQSGGGKDEPKEDKTETPDEVSDTDNALRSNEGKMLSSERGGVIKFFSEKLALDAMVPYKEYYSADRQWTLHRTQSVPGFNRWDHITPTDAFALAAQEAYKKFMTDTNKAVSYMAKEFEQKKAAYQYSRAKTSTSGTLNTTALHKYKFSEDVFKRVTTLADAKSHGMVISIDMSGSMSGVLMDTIKQALNLALFCRRVGIPFEMYGFTCGRTLTAEQYRDIESQMLDGTLHLGTFRYIQFFSHKMKKSEFDHAVRDMFFMGCGRYCDYDDLGSTPTNEMLMALTYLIKRFRKETGVQKMMNIVLTDGEPNRAHVHYDYETSRRSMNGGNNYNMVQLKNNKIAKISNMGNSLSKVLLENIAKECDCKNFGYFLGDSGALKNAIYRITMGSWNEGQAIKSAMRKEGGASVDNVMGYDRYILVKSSSFGIDEAEFEVAEDAKKSTIAREFAKFTKGRRTSRILLDRFVQAVA